MHKYMVDGTQYMLYVISFYIYKHLYKEFVIDTLRELPAHNNEDVPTPRQ
jgi:carbon starvation protein CstA